MANSPLPISNQPAFNQESDPITPKWSPIAAAIISTVILLTVIAFCSLCGKHKKGGVFGDLDYKPNDIESQPRDVTQEMNTIAAKHRTVIPPPLLSTYTTTYNSHDPFFGSLMPSNIEDRLPTPAPTHVPRVTLISRPSPPAPPHEPSLHSLFVPAPRTEVSWDEGIRPGARRLDLGPQYEPSFIVPSIQDTSIPEDGWSEYN
ncbi:uncharacterized protein BDR25DRAFT_300422 [Lindgomyces ingoldianus]|uniref:Uncharacterized protein n=1 Tax=Lindgomyces ingoldianus TaxID=673940 RepID=A0ACB6RD54_9PLEO|nr:uncharacterized protein BDR25DRAFT_300422 [Lindgomyces ingoldianus]KAF2476406.1 hypothetical protein BDR25DRAFT_300422 [Lindgomyces ingoldianus]